jgi:hypothetical protein
MSVHDVSGDRSAPVPGPHKGPGAPGIDPSIIALALLYTNGELDAPEAAGFEARLGAEQSAREALCEAVQLTMTLGGASAPRPDPSYRERVRDQLLSTTARTAPVSNGWWSGLLRPRLYPGHPALWALGGALAAVLVVGFALPRPSSAKTEIASSRTPAPNHASPPTQEAEEGTERDPAELEQDPSTEMVHVWAELHTSEHLVRVHDEEQRRRHRVEEHRTGRDVMH